jgi:dipeptidyl-peptidase-4
VYLNNLYIQSSPTSAPVQVTTDGDLTYVFNGAPNWLYEEDVISERVSHYWSPDSSYVVYARINDTEVPLQSWPVYGPKTDVYGKIRQITYPKAGDVRNGTAGPTSKAELFVVPVAGSPSTLLPPPAALANVDHYYLAVSWRDTTHAYVTWGNRVQNRSISTIYDVAAASPVPVTNLDFTQTGGWVEVPPPSPWFIDSGARYLTVQPSPGDAQTGAWRHLAVLTSPVDAAGTQSFLTSGLEEIQYVQGYDAVRKVVYYQSTHGDPAERHTKRVGLSNAAPADQPAVCLTCGYPETCRYISASFSDSTHYYIERCQGPDVPTYTLKSMVPGEETKAVVFENNDLLRTRLSEKLMPVRQFLTVPVGGGYDARVEMFIPPNPTPGEKFPLLVYVYAGPGSQRVMKTFPIGGSTTNWLNYLRSSHRIAVASIDGRGSMAAGDKLKFEMYRKLGTVEVIDQILAGTTLRNLDYIDDTKRSAIFGWSYGGGTTAHVMGDPSQVFTCGVSVAPVTTKSYYDTAYTERYLAMATPDDDELGYNNTDVMHKAPNFMGKKFMISHGTADDNVHFMHTVHLASALADADVLFRSNIYMDQNHNINSPGQSRHLYHTMSDFVLNECWDLGTSVKAASLESAATGLTPTLALATLSLLISWLIYA